MRLGQLLILTLAVFLATSDAIAEDPATTLRRPNHLHEDGGDISSNVSDEEAGERAPSFASKLNVFLGTKSGVNTKLGGIFKDRAMLEALKSPSVKNLQTAALKDENFVTTLAKNPKAVGSLKRDPSISKAMVAIKKANVKLDEEKLRFAVRDNPAAQSRLRRSFSDLGLGAQVFGGSFGILLLFLTVIGIVTGIDAVVKKATG